MLGKSMHWVMTIVLALVMGACSVAGVRSGTETPAYTVVARVGEDVEIRDYGPRLVAEVLVAGAEEEARTVGFRQLAAFIFGENAAGTKIAMTAPVGQAQAAASERIAMTAPVAQAEVDVGRWRVRFVMPAAYTRETLPMPLDPGVTILELPAETLAVIRFSGSPAPSAVVKATARLRDVLEGGGWEIAGTPEAWFYDPPWTVPLLRRNEVAVPVRRSARGS